MQTPDADRTVHLLDPEAFDAFLAMIDEPERPRPKLEALLARPTVFDR